MNKPITSSGFKRKIEGAGLGTPFSRVVLGLGNLLYSDEGFGIHALQALQKTVDYATEIDWVDGGVLGLNLLPLVENSSYLLVLDAIDTGSPPGSYIEIDQEHIPLFAGIKMSEHQVGFQEVLGLALLRNTFPAHLHLIGVQPACLETGIELSHAAAATLPLVVKRARETLNRWSLI